MNLLIDMDGTLLDTSQGIFNCIRYSLKELEMPLHPKTNLDWCIGPGIHFTMAKFLGKKQAHLVDEAVRLFRVHYKKEGMYQAKVYSGVRQCLTRLEKQHKLFVATAKPTKFAKLVAKHFKLDKYFENIYGSELDGTNSKKGDLITTLLKNKKVLLNSVMIGDREHDIHGAHQNRISGFGVAWGYGSISELKNARAKKIFRAPQDMSDYFCS